MKPSEKSVGSAFQSNSCFSKAALSSDDIFLALVVNYFLAVTNVFVGFYYVIVFHGSGNKTVIYEQKPGRLSLRCIAENVANLFLSLSSPRDVITLFVITKCLINQLHPASEPHFLFRHAHIALTLLVELTHFWTEVVTCYT